MNLNNSEEETIEINNKKLPIQNDDTLQNYKKLRVIGRGAFGLCLLYQDKKSILNRKVVIKSVSLECLSHSERNSVLYEATLLAQLAHPNIVHLHSSFIEHEQLFIVMEYADGGTMEKLIQERNGRPLGQDLVLYYFVQITLAIHYIHCRNILHRDLKPQNIFLNRKRTIVKVGDFGISKELKTKNLASTVIGTANYLSPEICEGRAYDLKSDIWSMGCVLYELIELCKAFDGDSFPSIVLKITRGKHRPFSDTTNMDIRKLILKMLQLDENQRPTTKKLLTDRLMIKKWYEVHVELGRINPLIEECTKETYLTQKRC